MFISRKLIVTVQTIALGAFTVIGICAHHNSKHLLPATHIETVPADTIPDAAAYADITD